MLEEIVETTQQIDGWLSRDEATALALGALKTLDQGIGGDWLEIGSWHGRSTVLLGSLLRECGRPGQVLYAVDPHEGVVPVPSGTLKLPSSWLPYRHNLIQYGVDNRVVTIRRRLEECGELLPPLVSFAYIDSLHDYETTWRHFEIVRQIMAREGRIAFHDAGPEWPEVAEVVDEIIAHGARCDLVGSLAVLTRQEWRY